MKRECAFCPVPLGEAYIVSHELNRDPVTAHVDCWGAAKAAEQLASLMPKPMGQGVAADIRKLYADIESVRG